MHGALAGRRRGDHICRMRRADEERRTKSLAGLAAALALVVASLYLIGALRAAARYQDCVLSGRAFCLVLARN